MFKTSIIVMTIRELQEKQADLSERIRSLIYEFQQETGLSPEIKVINELSNGVLYVQIETTIQQL